MHFNDQRGPVSPIGMAAFVTVHAGIFMGIHFMFLWILFSGEWSGKIHGFGTFIDQMVIATGLWVPLAILFVVHGALMLFDGMKPLMWRTLGFVDNKPIQKSLLGPGESIVFGLFVRIFVIQVTIIVGAWFALLAGTAVVLAFLILVKTAMEVSFDLVVEKFAAAKAAAEAEMEKQN